METYKREINPEKETVLPIVLWVEAIVLCANLVEILEDDYMTSMDKIDELKRATERAMKNEDFAKRINRINGGEPL